MNRRQIVGCVSALVVCSTAFMSGAGSDVADAVMKGDRAAVRKLLAAKADVNAPQVDGATAWLGSEPLSPAGLRGQVVLTNFWTLTCINWLRQEPYVRAWSEAYRDDGLVVIGSTRRTTGRRSTSSTSTAASATTTSAKGATRGPSA